MQAPERRVFLTGGTGFIGAHAARALCEDGWSLRAAARDPAAAAARAIRGLGAEIVGCDLSTHATLKDAARGCAAIVHVAGLVKAASLEEYREVNARGTERLLSAAAASAPDALFVLISSQAAAGPARNGVPVREGDAARPVSWYGISKMEAEEAVAGRWKGPWIVLRPAVVYGPGDRGLLTLFRAAARGIVPVPAGRSRIQLIFAPRAGAAIARAASRPDLSGRIGFLCDPEPVVIRDFARKLARLPQRRARLLPVPDALVRAAGAIETLRERLSRRSRPFNADKAREILAGDWVCDPRPMLKDLDLPAPPSLEDGLEETWDWYLREGWLTL